jgi:hypothetical protein
MLVYKITKTKPVEINGQICQCNTWETYIEDPFNGIEERIHWTEESAQAYIRAAKKRYIIEALERYIEHKQKILDTTHFYYRTAHKLRSLGLCKIHLTGLQGKTTRDICCRILVMRDHLERILPHSKNSSFLSERKKLQEIIAFAMHETGLYLKSEQNIKQLKLEV